MTTPREVIAAYISLLVQYSTLGQRNLQGCRIVIYSDPALAIVYPLLYFFSFFGKHFIR